jgi:hypothetical protein
MAEGDLIQQSQIPSRVNPDAGVGPGATSDDAKASVAETQRLQAEAQARINAGRQHGLTGRRPGPGESLGVSP